MTKPVTHYPPSRDTGLTKCLSRPEHAPKHRRCTRDRHHVWTYSGPTGTGWTIARCVMCGKTDIA